MKADRLRFQILLSASDNCSRRACTDFTISRADNVPHVRCVDSREQWISDSPGADNRNRYALPLSVRKLCNVLMPARRPPACVSPGTSSPNNASCFAGMSPIGIASGSKVSGFGVSGAAMRWLRNRAQSSRWGRRRTMPFVGNSSNRMAWVRHQRRISSSRRYPHK